MPAFHLPIPVPFCPETRIHLITHTHKKISEFLTLFPKLYVTEFYHSFLLMLKGCAILYFSLQIFFLVSLVLFLRNKRGRVAVKKKKKGSLPLKVKFCIFCIITNSKISQKTKVLQFLGLAGQQKLGFFQCQS